MGRSADRELCFGAFAARPALFRSALRLFFPFAQLPICLPTFPSADLPTAKAF
jgi:hypothetical protein